MNTTGARIYLEGSDSAFLVDHTPGEVLELIEMAAKGDVDFVYFRGVDALDPQDLPVSTATAIRPHVIAAVMFSDLTRERARDLERGE